MSLSGFGVQFHQHGGLFTLHLFIYYRENAGNIVQLMRKNAFPNKMHI